MHTPPEQDTGNATEAAQTPAELALAPDVFTANSTQHEGSRQAAVKRHKHGGHG